jgi:RHS repeat-associated protein
MARYGRAPLLDPMTGGSLYYMRARYLDTGMGRFVTRDPQGLLGSNFLAMYCYANNNPLAGMDPSGKFTVAFGFGGSVTIGGLNTGGAGDSLILGADDSATAGGGGPPGASGPSGGPTGAPGGAGSPSAPTGEGNPVSPTGGAGSGNNQPEVDLGSGQYYPFVPASGGMAQHAVCFQGNLTINGVSQDDFMATVNVATQAGGSVKVIVTCGFDAPLGTGVGSPVLTAPVPQT